MKKTAFILIAIVMTTQTSCSQQPKIFGEKPLKLENFDFDLNIETFIPEKYYSQEYQLIVIPVKSGEVSFKRDTIYSDSIYFHTHNEFSIQKIPEWILYYERFDSSDDWQVKYGEFPFRNIGFAVSLDNKMMAVGARTPYRFNKEMNNDFIRLLTNEYGNYRVESGDGILGSIYIKYIWELNDRIIHYWAYRNAEDTNYAGYFYIYKKEYADKIMKTFKMSF
jgi:hypothetical protein